MISLGTALRLHGTGRPMVDVKFLTSFDRRRLASGGTEAFDFIGADTIQSIYTEYALI